MICRDILAVSAWHQPFKFNPLVFFVVVVVFIYIRPGVDFHFDSDFFLFFGQLPSAHVILPPKSGAFSQSGLWQLSMLQNVAER